jgi:hypothetical protein
LFKKIILMGAVALVATIAATSLAVAKGNPSADSDCSTVLTDPYGLLGTGTRAELYGCTPTGNSGEEQGLYQLEGPASLFGYPADYGTCIILVKWSGDYGETPYLDFGTVFNLTKCSNGYVEVWGDRFDESDGFGATPYVYTIGGEGDQVHHPKP